MSDFEYELENNDTSHTNFDLKGLLFKILNYWPLFLASITIGLSIAHYVNVRKENIYRLESLISIENEQNPFFTANTSISFNWGGVSGQVGKVITEINTRTHNELVVDSLEFYKQYLKQGEYHLKDIYKNSPFTVIIDKNSFQILGKLIEMRPIDNESFELIINFEESTSVNCQNYKTRELKSIPVSSQNFKKTFKYTETIDLPYFKAQVFKTASLDFQPEVKYYVKFLNFDDVVNQYKNIVEPQPKSKDAPSILIMAMVGKNKAKIVDYLNTTVAILSRTGLDRKNLYATNTINFIDSSLSQVNNNLKLETDEMNNFRKKNKVFNVTDELTIVSENLKELDYSKQSEKTKLNYLNSLEKYLLTKTDYSKIAAPTSVGISEENIIVGVANITALAIERQNLEYTAKEGNVLFDDLDRRVKAQKNVLLETVRATKTTINYLINSINKNISKLEAELRDLPEDQQEFLKIQRKLDISIETYNIYQSKLSEAAVVKAANVSDIVFIDEAKDIGNAPIGPKKSLNYMMALLIGLALPMSFVFFVHLLDNSIHSVADVDKLSKIPILGLIGRSSHRNNLIVFEKQKSTIAESFRALRSSLQFIFRKQLETTSFGKTLMITSSVSGEGKTFCSINMASVYALTGKKTILLGLDLRKPKIFGDFNLDNDKGIVNYLIGQNSLSDVIINTHIENLDLISSGPIPPNPSELLMGDMLKDAIAELRQNYDIIILDTPPLGLVADALELSHYADAIIYVVRFDYTKKGMLQLVNAKYRSGELKNVSFVLNFFKHKARYGYGYNYGYGYGYGSYGNSYHENEKVSVIDKFKRFFKRK